MARSASDVVVMPPCTPNHACALGRMDECALMQDIASEGQPLHILDPAASGNCAPMLKCSFRPAGQKSANPGLATMVATCSGNVSAPVQATVLLWSCDSGALQQTFDAGTRAVADIAWSRCGRFIAAAAMTTCVSVWEADTGKQVSAADVSKAALAVCWAESGLLAVGMTDGAVEVVDLQLGD
jgi:WD40 repeat protein